MLSGHPLDENKETLKIQCELNIGDILSNARWMELLEDEETAIGAADISQLPISDLKLGNLVGDGTKVTLGGIISEVTSKTYKNNDMMAFVMLEDLFGTIEVIVFPKVFEKVASLINPDQLIMIRGRVSVREEEAPKILCEDIQPLVKVNESNVYVLVEDDKSPRDINKSLKEILLKYRGNTPLYLCTKKERKKYRMDRDHWVDCESGVIQYLQKQFGEENVKVK